MRKMILLLIGAVWIGGCSLIQQAGGDDIRVRLQYLEEEKVRLELDQEILRGRIVELEADARARESTPRSALGVDDPYTESELCEIEIRQAAEEDGFTDVDFLIALAKCESGGNVKINRFARLHTRKEDSNGPFQINLDAHNVDLDMAQDCHESAHWAIAKIREQGGSSRDWTRCTAIIQGGGHRKHHHRRK